MRMCFLATKTDGTLWSCGTGNAGGNASNNQTQYSSPIQIPGTDWRTSAPIARSTKANGATKTDGTLWVWGNNMDGQLGVNNDTQYSSPIQVPGSSWYGAHVGGGSATNEVIFGSLVIK